MRIIRWLETAVLGASVAGACAAPAAAGDNAATPPSASTPPAWQMVIAPRHGPAVVVDFHEEADGSLSAQHRVIRPGEHIGGPLNQQLAPLPTPVENPPVQGPALSPDSAKRPTPVRRKTAEVETRKNPFRLIGQESEAIDNAAEKGPLLPEPPPPLDPIPEAVQEPKPSNVVPAPMVTKPKPPALPDENVVPPQPPAEEKPAEESPDAASSEATSPEEAGVAPDGSALPAWPPGMGHRPSYADIYFSIPFLRTEYDANPSYRHEATMEILFGQLRPTVVHKETPRPIVHRHDYNYITPYRYWNGRGYVNYNFFYPRPSVYRNY